MTVIVPTAIKNWETSLFLNRQIITTANVCPGDYEFFYFYNRAFSDSEIFDIYHDPYQFLVPA